MDQVMSCTSRKGWDSVPNHLILPILFLVQDGAQPYGASICV